MSPYCMLNWLQWLRFTRPREYTYSYVFERSDKTTEAKYPDIQELVSHASRHALCFRKGAERLAI